MKRSACCAISPLLALCAAPAAAQDMPVSEAFAGIPNLRVEYYDVSGHTAKAIRKAMDARHMTDANDSAPIDARSRWHIFWTWTARTDEQGQCRVDEIVLRYAAEVRLPRLAEPDRVPDDVRERWARYLAALEMHEAGHLRYALDHLGDIHAALQTSACTDADKAASKALAPLQQHDLDYDRETRHGMDTGAVFP